MEREIRQLETMAMNACPALNTYYYDGWNLGFTGGYTNRANSVIVLGDSTLPLEEKIHFCEQMYEKQHLATVFKVTPLSRNIDTILENLHYKVVTKTNTMVMEIPDITLKESSVVVTPGINDKWEQSFFNLTCLEEEKIPWAKKVLHNILNQTLCATVLCDNKVVGCGLCVIENGYAQLYDIFVAEPYRRMGYGKDICCSLLCESQKYGAHKAYLQVVADNEKAIRLYQQLGFTNQYQYWYRVKDI